MLLTVVSASAPALATSTSTSSSVLGDDDPDDEFDSSSSFFTTLWKRDPLSLPLELERWMTVFLFVRDDDDDEMTVPREVPGPGSPAEEASVGVGTAGDDGGDVVDDDALMDPVIGALLSFRSVPSSSWGRILQTHSGASPLKWTTPFRLMIMYLLSLLTRRSSQTPFPSGAVSLPSCRAAKESMKAALSNLTESSQSRSQNDAPMSSDLDMSRNRPTDSLTKLSRPEESKTTIRSGMARRICSFLRSSSFSSFSSSMNCFLRFLDICADFRFAARF
mmetsp:Transcript_45862/g.111848  ORF Transcript_45862/g.111848 Transcript_45862/m.111848 type:complete len:277 (+) Transcript_45862:634-1464(+)